MRSRLLPLLALLPLLWSARPAARADEAPADTSPASQAFRDAWWAETGGGDLTQALALYAKAAEAEGPAGVRARALYRRAVVLQRLGRTEEAIKALERLATEHPGETQLAADARARLSEWTAVDLRTGFPEWYRRFQYGPEFQAKVVDLVLKLGTGDNVARSGVENELLTIGEPAVAALQAHVRSRNEDIAQRSVKMLLLLDVVPDEVTQHFGMWTGEQGAWATILALPEARRAQLRARVGSGSFVHEALRAALGDSDALLTWAATPPVTNERTVRYPLLSAFFKRLPASGPLTQVVLALSAMTEIDRGLRGMAAEWALGKKLVTADLVKAWIAQPDDHLTWSIALALADPGVMAPRQAWPLLLGMIERRGGEQQHIHPLMNCLHTLLPSQAWPDALEGATAALLRGWNYWVQAVGLPEASPRLLEVVARALDRAPEGSNLDSLMQYWSRYAAGEAGGSERLYGWVREGATPRLRWLARSAWFERVTTAQLDQAVDVLADPSAADNEIVERWELFFARCPVAAGAFAPPERFQRLLDRLGRAVDTAALFRLPEHLLRPELKAAATDALVERLLSAPERFPGYSLLDKSKVLMAQLRAPGRLTELHRAWRASWSTWTPEQRSSALMWLTRLFPEADAETQAFLSARLRAKPSDIPDDWRLGTIDMLATLSLDDVRAYYDLSLPADVDEAASWLTRGAASPPILEATPAALEALRGALRPDGDASLAQTLADWFMHVVPDEERRLPLVRLLLAHRNSSVRYKGVVLLTQRSNPADADLWVAALKDEAVLVRGAAAKGIERVPGPVTLKALVAALDDPHPDVRSNALESLDAIQKMEDLKARWKERVR